MVVCGGGLIRVRTLVYIMGCDSGCIFGFSGTDAFRLPFHMSFVGGGA